MKKVENSGLLTLFQKGQIVSLKKGDLIIQSNTYQRSVFYIQQGFVSAYSTDFNNTRKFLAIYKPGEIFPLSPVFIPVKRNISYYSLSNTLLFKMASTKFKQLINTNHKAALEVINIFSQLDIIHTDRLASLELKDTYQRLVARILLFADRFGEKVRSTFIIRIPLTQSLIAQLISSSRETVTRELQILEKKKLVVYNKNLITILDKKRLEEEVKL